MYSQKKEDNVIWAYFKDKEPGNLLDIGANDGRLFSNSLWLIEHGWGGVLVEPSPTAFEKLKETHKDNPKIILFNYAITDYDGTVDFYESGEVKVIGRIKNQSLVSTIFPKYLKVWENRKTLFKKLNLSCKSFESFLEESPIKKFEFITIDTEGEDYIILKQMDLNALGCQFVCVEHNQDAPKEQFEALLEPQGFKYATHTSVNLLMSK